MARLTPLPPKLWPESMRAALAALRPADARHPRPQTEGRPKALNALGTLALHPELTKAFNDSASDSDGRVLAQQREMMTGVIGGLALLVVLIGLLGIYFTHKVAGPIHKMKSLLRQVGDGKLHFKGGLRKGDELQEFFETFQHMVDSLRKRQSGEIERLEAALTAAKEAGAPEAALEKIAAVRDEMQSALDE